MNKTVFFIDDDEYERRGCTDILNEIFADTTIHVEPLAPLQTLENYAAFLVGGEASALILDEKLTTAGSVTYTGAELAAHLRAIGSKIPIVILTNYLDEDDSGGDISKQGWAIECAYAKKSVLRDPTTPEALEFKARLSRQIEISGAVRAEHEQRYHDLLVKSGNGTLIPDEAAELRALEDERIAPISAAEREKQKKLEMEIENLKRLLGEGPML